MAFIYLIWNDINDKEYVGKTEFSLEHRFAEHCRDAFHPKRECRPLYRAMRKYGIEHFHISFLEETDNPEERETYWILKRGTFTNGYNATMGGDGKRVVDYEEVVKTYRELGSQRRTAEALGLCVDTVRYALKSCGVERMSSRDINVGRFGKAVDMLSRDGELICSFESIANAAVFIAGERGVESRNICPAHISQVCKGRRKSAYGYSWRFQTENSNNDFCTVPQPVDMYSMEHKLLMSFDSVSSAMAYIAKASAANNNPGIKSHISDVCRGLARSAYGYIWKFREASDSLAS